MDESKREEIALFRYGLILPFLKPEELQWGMQGEILRHLAAEHYDIPHSTKHTIDEESIRKWLAAYKKHGFDGLKPKPRNDKGKPRKIPPEAFERATALRTEAPSRSVRKIIQIMEAHNLIEPGQIKPSTLARQLKEHGFDRKSLKANTQIFRRFEAERPNQIWQSDILYGPYLPDPNHPERTKRTYLVAFLDDFSRLIPEAEFYWDEKFPALENTFKKAMLRRGVPEVVYVDNGKVYSARRLDAVCAALGIRKIHCKPYSPEGKGKIERFFRTVREQFLAEPEITTVETLPELNRLFRAWLEIDYHQKTHSSTKEPPLGRWQNQIGNFLRAVDEKQLTELFLWQTPRKVSAVGTLSVAGIEFEVEGFLKGKKVEVRYNPFNLEWVNIYYKEQFIGKAKPHTLARWNSAAGKSTESASSGQTSSEDDKPSKPGGIKPLKATAEQHQRQKKQTAEQLVGKGLPAQAGAALAPLHSRPTVPITLPALLKLLADAIGRKPEQMHAKEIDATKRLLAEHPDLSTECAAIAMGKAVLTLGKSQHIHRYLDTIKSAYLKRKER